MSNFHGFIEHVGNRSILDPDGQPPSNLFEAIRDHLIILLNTRRGSIPHLPSYGLPDLSEIYEGYPDSLHYLGAEIKKTIERFETRLVHLRIELTSSSSKYFEANYSITGFLQQNNGKKVKVTFRTQISQGGSATIND